MKHDVYGHIIEIWEPRYKDNKALIGKHHVVEGINYITFTKAPKLKERVYEVHSATIKAHPVQANGRGEVYCVPMKALKPVGYLSDKKLPTVTITNDMVVATLENQGVLILERNNNDEPIFVQGKRNNILITVYPQSVFFDEFVREKRTYLFRELEGAFSWKNIEDIILDNIPAEITKEAETENINNPLLL